VPLAASHPDVVKTVIKIHRLGNEWMELLGGRMTHPVTLKPGGLSKLPTEKELRGLKARLTDIIADLRILAGFVAGVADKLPAFDRETEYISLKNGDHYTFYHGNIASTDTPQVTDIHAFESVVNEYVTPHSTAKWTKWHRDSYAVGALARFNINGDLLLPEAKKTAQGFGLVKGSCNPFLNNVAQVVECVQIVEHSLELLDTLLSGGIRPETPKSAPRAGEGVGCVEAPRGILFHRYAFDDKGMCTRANICIPTNQNHANIQKDFEAFVPQILDQGQDRVRLLLEMLVRSYDPCISCSTHYLDVEFV
jgi:sulfhydrogenase subunit alpha